MSFLTSVVAPRIIDFLEDSLIEHTPEIQHAVFSELKSLTKFLHNHFDLRISQNEKEKNAIKKRK